MTPILVKDIDRQLYAGYRKGARGGQAHLRLSASPTGAWTRAFADLVLRHSRDLLAGVRVGLGHDADGAYVVVSYGSLRERARLIRTVDELVRQATAVASARWTRRVRRLVTSAAVFAGLVALPAALSEAAFSSPTPWIAGCVTVATTGVAAGFTGPSSVRRGAALLVAGSLVYALALGLGAVWA